MNFITPNWPAPKNIKAYTTLKSGWQSREKDADDSIIQSLLNMPTKPLWLTQKHTADTVEAVEENRLKVADASFSRQPNQVCAVLTADCLPVLICDKDGTQVAAAHAGWRGLAAGLIENTVSTFNSPADNLLVWLGPAIGPQKFEVGIDVYDAFVGKHPESAAAFKPHNEGKWMANLYHLAKIRLGMLGIKHIYGGDYCTYSSEDLFYSFRRDKGKLGNLASVIWLSG